MSEDVSLRDHIETQLKSQRELLEAKLLAIQNEVTANKETQELKNTASNEWRNALVDQRARFASNDSLDAVKDKVNVIENQLAGGAGQFKGVASVGNLVGWLISAVIGAVAAYAALH